MHVQQDKQRNNRIPNAMGPKNSLETVPMLDASPNKSLCRVCYLVA